MRTGRKVLVTVLVPCLPCRAKKKTYFAFRKKKLMNLREGSLKCNLPAETGVPRVINPGGLSQCCMSLFSRKQKVRSKGSCWTGIASQGRKRRRLQSSVRASGLFFFKKEVSTSSSLFLKSLMTQLSTHTYSAKQYAPKSQMSPLLQHLLLLGCWRMKKSTVEFSGARTSKEINWVVSRLTELEGQHFWDAFFRAADWSAQLTMQMWGE